MSEERKVDLSTLLYDLNRQVKDRISRLKKENPLLVDYLELEEKELEKQFNDILTRSPVIAEDEAMVFFNHDRVSKNLSKIEHGGFPYLWDDVLYKLMKKANDNNLGITNHWVKVLIASNLLELSLNQALINKNPSLFEKLRRDNAGIMRKTEEVNKILEKENLGKLKRSDIKFINSHRVDADHPISEFIKDLDPHDSLNIIVAVTDIIECLEPLLESKGGDSNFEAEILDKGPFHRGEIFQTKIRFKGKLVGGFFDNRIEAPVGKTFPSGSEIWWCPDPMTAPGPINESGKLVGDGEWKSTWTCKIPNDYPIGKYKVNICVYDHLGPGNRPVIKEKTITIDVIE